jgi:hypothetical protein
MKSVPSSGYPTIGTQKDGAVQQRGRDLVPSFADENDVTFGDQGAGEFRGQVLVGRTGWQVEGRFGPGEEREWNFGGQLQNKEPHFDR